MGPIFDEERLLAHLESNPREYLYRIIGGSFWGVTHGGRVPSDVVERMIFRKVLRPVYSNTFDAYGLRPTIDVEASLAARATDGRKAAIIYVS
jgi:hypothetical protein